MMKYIEGFVVAVPTTEKDSYLKHATEVAALIKVFSATRIVECWGDDVPHGKVTDFHWAVKTEKG